MNNNRPYCVSPPEGDGDFHKTKKLKDGKEDASADISSWRLSLKEKHTSHGLFHYIHIPAQAAY